MRKTCLKYGLVVVMLVSSAAGLIGVSQKVQRIEGEIAAYDHQIEREQERIRVLKAEWAFLNDPARLDALASGALGLGATNSENVVSNTGDIPDYETDVEADAVEGVIPVSYDSQSEGGQ